MNAQRRTVGHPARGVLAPSITSGNPLQLLVARRMVEVGEKTTGDPLSAAQVVARSGKRAGKPRLSKPTVTNILNGKTVKLRPDTVTGLATALDLDPKTIEAAIRQTTEYTMSLPARLTKLSPEAWDMLIAFGDTLLLREGKFDR